MKQIVINSIRALIPYILIAMVCGLIFGHFFIFLFLTILVFIFTQLIQLHYLQKWCADQSVVVPSVGLNRIWKNIYFLIETKLYDKNRTPELTVDELKNTVQGDYGLVLLKAHRIEWFNEQAATLLKLDADRDVNTDISHLLRTPNFLDALEDKRYGQEIMLDDRQPPIAVCLLPYGVRHLCLLVRDISLYMRMMHTNRELMANLTHELRSPLTVIQGYLEILKDTNKKTKDKNFKNILANMQTQVVRMKVLVDDTLNIAYLENTELKAYDQSYVDVPAMLESILEISKIDAPPSLFNTQIETFNLYGKASELHSMFHNLIDNAKSHSQSDDIKIVWRKDDSGAYFEVIDKGIGIETDHLPKLSKRFYRVDKARSITQSNAGLGLSIVKHVLNRHQATLEIESEVGKGSTFRCCFPLSRIKA